MNEAYLHSPVDDLESLFWVAVWSVAFNEDHISLPTSDREKKVREELARGEKLKAISLSRGSTTESDIMQRFYRFIKEWWSRVSQRSTDWEDEIVAKAPADAGEGYYLSRFHRSALRGVVDFLELVSAHWGEIGKESWIKTAE